MVDRNEWADNKPGSKFIKKKKRTMNGITRSLVNASSAADDAAIMPFSTSNIAQSYAKY